MLKYVAYFDNQSICTHETGMFRICVHIHFSGKLTHPFNFRKHPSKLALQSPS